MTDSNFSRATRLEAKTAARSSWPARRTLTAKRRADADRRQRARGVVEADEQQQRVEAEARDRVGRQARRAVGALAGDDRHAGGEMADDVAVFGGVDHGILGGAGAPAENHAGDPASVRRRSQTSLARRSRTAATNAGVGSLHDRQRAVLAEVLVVADRARRAGSCPGLSADRRPAPSRSARDGRCRSARRPPPWSGRR